MVQSIQQLQGCERVNKHGVKKSWESIWYAKPKFNKQKHSLAEEHLSTKWLRNYSY